MSRGNNPCAGRNSARTRSSVGRAAIIIAAKEARLQQYVGDLRKKYAARGERIIELQLALNLSQKRARELEKRLNNTISAAGYVAPAGGAVGPDTSPRPPDQIHGGELS